MCFGKDLQSDGKRKRCIHDLVSLFSRFGFFWYFSNTLFTILSLEVYVELLCPPTGFWGGDMEDGSTVFYATARRAGMLAFFVPGRGCPAESVA